MRKSILFGSIFVLSLILLMPSIPAIQYKTIEEKAYSDFEEEIKTLDDDIKLPILYAIVVYILRLRFNKMRELFDIAVTITEWHGGYEWDVHHPFLLLFVILMDRRISFSITFWRNISNRLNLDWTMDYSIFHDE